ncbi:hypothetical protein [Arthrobacter glacialis]|uniref:Uncharacterized protein n=1 Tax=Arthrobacter glacialis TaxID=1664 RepID=A0A2S3ZU21_ARTGL|nr:hypothetical protein [Arthrobacter glacialis]POH57206.1 hypothetical protein CVS28_16495 [Arthrobacter glacialis]POH72347.1 hypothetical protein CVS27_15745 [Arthrobacter glacialis]
MVVLVLAALVCLTAAATVWLIRTRATAENDPDATFWYAFAGLCVAAPLILIPALTSSFTSLALFAVALATTVATHKLVVRRQITAAATDRRRQLSLALSTANHEHDALMTRWGRYELDPAAAIDFPAMSDVRVPETSALAKAARAAASLRHGPGCLTRMSLTGDVPADDGVAEYQRAVAMLAEALETAEKAAQGCLARQ